MPSGNSASAPRQDLKFIGWASVVLVGLSAAASTIQLGEPGLWVDETYTWFFATMGWKDMLQAARIDGVNPPFFYIYTKLFADLLGTSEAALRVPSILAHSVGTVASIWLGYQAAGRAGSLVSGWFFAFHPMLLWFARDARPYALTAALAVLSLLLFCNLKRTPKTPTTMISAGIIVSLGLLTHYFFLLFAAVTGLLAMRELERQPRFLRHWFLVLLVAMLPLLIWIWWFLQLPEPSFGIGWIRAPDPLDLIATMWNLLSGYGGGLGLGSSLFGLLAASLLGFGLRKRWITVVLALVLPLIGVWVLSQFRPVYVDRYFVVLVPFIMLTAAEGGGWLWERTAETPLGQQDVAAPAAISLLTLVALSAVVNLHQNPVYAKEDWGTMARWLNRQDDTANILLSEPEIMLPLSYYYGGRAEDAGMIADNKCGRECIWVLRQPYTYSHAFTQSVSDPARPAWQPPVPEGCAVIDQAQTQATGAFGWFIECDG